ncbi:cysteine proteinase [Metschnikowia bicuspidata var. bicuspidata NRRL YB-4993]|uniref:Cysteine proteinase n=1 Tax=Metschnikowia bicuspidata var. bicuspidata NRRL YB-4993 TaxID=869754 RepID=A0A1A0HJD0_9ASCO|nr:cysteine proteinase [Metschnikowia bicuspidata var. bicuspidata NRRL YB-4993]OBA23992.1 cysteine proteinase [Metschnikowia bicuspidata var. bicuspidata NRRL YB-4993]
MEELLARHRKEQKDLIAQITSLKKQALKKTRKSVNTKCADLQSSLQARHAKEIADLSSDSSISTDSFTPEQLLAAMNLGSSATLEQAIEKTAHQESSSQSPGKKRNRARERLAKRQAQIDAMTAEAQAEAADSVDYRAIEAESMGLLLRALGLQMYEIQPDGHCLFRSIQDQLHHRHEFSADAADLSVSAIRRRAADHIRAHPDSYIPYLFDQETMSVQDVGEYTKELEETAMWGSDLEIAALAAVYECPIKVLVAGSAPIVFNEAGPKPELIVAYYKHSYGLGEHYNSCRDIERDVRV